MSTKGSTWMMMCEKSMKKLTLRRTKRWVGRISLTLMIGKSSSERIGPMGKERRFLRK
ncbi:hypothetical protein RHMOL_Rhmol10G0182400 [Rhododendron molle]|uniref:Uncharacterized protein n=1 Tax=Rhododendron molle TaxID=49168 RepID=A0ACC0M3R9_RHOML|nr:hypothetical protein RHMOL_Rhmol10G0182400 [Rhododendron molle]